MKNSLNSKSYQELRQWLIQKRNDQGVTVRKLAESVDIDYTGISKIENGVRRIDVVGFVQYCNAIDADPAEGIEIIQKHLSKNAQ